jgi:hypothetical protein
VARSSRINVPHGWYHVLNRGVERRQIFPRGALPAAFFVGQRYAGLRLKEMGGLAGGVEYPTVHAAVARFERRLKIDRDIQKKLKKNSKKFEN